MTGTETSILVMHSQQILNAYIGTLRSSQHPDILKAALNGISTYVMCTGPAAIVFVPDIMNLTWELYQKLVADDSTESRKVRAAIIRLTGSVFYTFEKKDLTNCIYFFGTYFSYCSYCRTLEICYQLDKG